VVTPFFFASLLPSVAYAYYSAIGMALLALFGLGIYLGRISRQNWIVSGARTTIVGVICIALSYFLEQLTR
jgi:predicted membrane protein (TIGR00267 family)